MDSTLTNGNEVPSTASPTRPEITEQMLADIGNPPLIPAQGEKHPWWLVGMDDWWGKNCRLRQHFQNKLDRDGILVKELYGPAAGGAVSSAASSGRTTSTAKPSYWKRNGRSVNGTNPLQCGTVMVPVTSLHDMPKTLGDVYEHLIKSHVDLPHAILVRCKGGYDTSDCLVLCSDKKQYKVGYLSVVNEGEVKAWRKKIPQFTRHTVDTLLCVRTPNPEAMHDMDVRPLSVADTRFGAMDREDFDRLCAGKTGVVRLLASTVLPHVFSQRPAQPILPFERDPAFVPPAEPILWYYGIGAAAEAKVEPLAGGLPEGCGWALSGRIHGTLPWVAARVSGTLYIGVATGEFQELLDQYSGEFKLLVG